MSKTLEITRDIVVATLGSTVNHGVYPSEETGKVVAEFIQIIYDKVKEIEKQEN